MKGLLISFAIALVVGSFINGYSPGTPTATTAEPGGDEVITANSLATQDATDSSFSADVLESDVPVLVDFWAEWCTPCKKMLPVIDQLATDYEGRVKVVRVDVDANPTVSDKYGVREIPTFLFFKNGKKVGKLVGITPKNEFVNQIEKLTSADSPDHG